jgi:dihydropteroate synthase
MEWRVGQRRIEFPRRPLVMGIVNVNGDSFSGDGAGEVGAALARAREQVEGGADIVDVGAESARTNRGPVSIDEEISRFAGVFARWPEVVAGLAPRDSAQLWPPVVAANTWRPEVVAAVLGMGVVELVNDMGGLPVATNAELCARAGASLLIMHSVGEPKVPHTAQRWDDVIASLEEFFTAKLAMALAAGLAPERIILDPGIDFAKQCDDNLTIFRDLGQLTRFGRPILVPISRKTVIGEVLNLPDPRDRDAGTLACLATGVRRGAAIFRVHEVAPAYQALKLLWEIEFNRVAK